VGRGDGDGFRKREMMQLESTRSDGFFLRELGRHKRSGHDCALPPIHMGSLKLKVKAKGYRPQELDVPTSELGESRPGYA